LSDTAFRRSNTSAPKLKKLASSSGKDIAITECAYTTPEDDDICEIEWKSPRPLSGNAYHYALLSGHPER